MLAQVQRTFGGPEALALSEVPDPVPAPGELLVRVRACGLNRLDLLQRVAPVVRGFTLPHIAGMDVAGEVVGRGDGVPADQLPDGTAVLIDPVSACGTCDRCTAGLAPYCEQLRTVGSTRPGGFAELVTTPADHVHRIPAGMSFVEAAAIPVPYIAAWHALVVAGGVRPGETVLVNAVASGVSIALVQLATHVGATVIGTLGGRDRVPLARRIGCDHVIDHRVQDVAHAVADITAGRGVDLAVDHVGPSLFASTIASLSIGGRMVLCGTTSGTRAEIDLPSVYHWGRTLIGAGGHLPGEFADLLATIERAGIRPVIDSVHPFRELPAAQARMEAGGCFGRLIVEM